MVKRKNYKTALEYRLIGKTYGEIKSALGVPKSTLSNWFSTLKLPRSAQIVLKEKSGRGLLALGKFNRTRTELIHAENEKTRNTFEENVGSITKRELMLIGAALCWGEGYKNFNNSRKSYPYLSFSNSDPAMIKTFLKFTENILDIPHDKIVAAAMIYPGLNQTHAINYWHSVTNIPKEKIRYYRALSRASSQKRPKKLLPYGTLQLRVNHRLNFFKVKGLIDGIVRQF